MQQSACGRGSAPSIAMVIIAIRVLSTPHPYRYKTLHYLTRRYFRHRPHDRRPGRTMRCGQLEVTALGQN